MSHVVVSFDRLSIDDCMYHKGDTLSEQHAKQLEGLILNLMGPGRCEVIHDGRKVIAENDGLPADFLASLDALRNRA